MEGPEVEAASIGAWVEGFLKTLGVKVPGCGLKVGASRSAV